MDRTDSRLRHAERSADAVTLLRERLRAGECTQDHVELAASLGHSDARELCPDVKLVNWEEGTQVRGALRRAALLLSESLPVRVAADWVERVLPTWEQHATADMRPHEAVAAARAWASCPCDEHRDAAQVAQVAVDAAAAEVIADANDDTPLARAAWAVATAADGAARAAGGGSAAAAFEANSVASSAVKAAYNADPEAERNWQRLCLAAYVLRQV